MLSLGFWEIVVIGALLLIVVGPERLPKVMRYAGKQYGMLRRAADEMRRAFVLEADRQDAEERYEQIKQRREAAKAAREAALKAAGEGAQAQDNPLPPPSALPIDAEVLSEGPGEPSQAGEAATPVESSAGDAPVEGFVAEPTVLPEDFDPDAPEPR